MTIPGIENDGHYNHMPQPAKRISLSAFMEKLLCSPASASGHETRQITPQITRPGPFWLTRVHIWWFESFGLAAEVLPNAREAAEADFGTTAWGFRFYYLGCEHKWKAGLSKGSQGLHDQIYTCSLCGAVERWDSS